MKTYQIFGYDAARKKTPNCKGINSSFRLSAIATRHTLHRFLPASDKFFASVSASAVMARVLTKITAITRCVSCSAWLVSILLLVLSFLTPVALAGNNTWSQIASLPTTTVSVFSNDPQQPNLMYAGGQDGVWRSTDYGLTWTSINNGLPSTCSGSSYCRSVTALAVSPADSAPWVSVQTGLYRYDDLLNTWTFRGPAPDAYGAVRIFNSIAFNASTVYVGHRNGASPGLGILKSSDAGANWSAITDNLVPGLISSSANRPDLIAVAKSNPAVLYAACSNCVNAAKGFFRSTDGGTSWSGIDGGSVGSISYGGSVGGVMVDHADAMHLWVVSAANSAGPKGLFASTDGGSNWNLLDSNAYAFWNTPGASVLSFAGSRVFFRNSSGGLYWRDSSNANQSISLSKSGVVGFGVTTDAAGQTRLIAGTTGPGGVWEYTFAVPTNGSCGAAHGGSFATAPTSNLCAVGTATSVTGSGPWSWSCLSSNSGTNSSCSANLSAVATFALNITKQGAGAGVVTSAPAGINCGSDCNENYANGTSTTLTATPASGSVFVGWSSGCSGTGTCNVTMNAAKNVTATFALLGNEGSYAPTCTLSASPSSVAAGSTSSTAPSGGSAGSMSTLTATCTPQAVSYRWSGECANTTASTCSVMPSQTTTYTVVGVNASGIPGAPASVTVSVTAVTPRLTLTVNLTGMENTGIVTSNPAGLTCTGRTCTGQFPAGSNVTLIPALAGGTGNRWWRWGGACADVPAGANCTITLDGQKSVDLGLGLFSAIRPVFPAATDKSEVMQGGRVARWFVLESGTSGVDVVANYSVDYQIEGEAPKTAITDADGLFAIVTDPQVVLTPNRDVPHRKRVRGMNGLLDAEFDLAVAARSLEQTWQIDTNLKEEIGVGPGFELKAKIAGYGPKLQAGVRVAGGLGELYTISAVHKANMRDDGYVYTGNPQSHLTRSMSFSEALTGAIFANISGGVSANMVSAPKTFLGAGADFRSEFLVDASTSATFKFSNYFDPVQPVGPCHLGWKVGYKLLARILTTSVILNSMRPESLICDSSIYNYLNELKTTSSISGTVANGFWVGLTERDIKNSGFNDSIIGTIKSTSLKLSGEGAFKITSEDVEKRASNGASIIGKEKKLELLYATKNTIDIGQFFRRFMTGNRSTPFRAFANGNISNSSERKLSRTDVYDASGNISGAKMGATLTSSAFTIGVGPAEAPIIAGGYAERIDTNLNIETDDARDIPAMPGLPLLNTSIGVLDPANVDNSILTALSPDAPATVKPLKYAIEKEVQLASFEVPFDLGGQLGIRLGLNGSVKVTSIEKFPYQVGKFQKTTYNGLTRSKQFDLEEYTDSDQYLNEQRKSWSVIFTQMDLSIRKFTEQTLQSAKALVNSTSQAIRVTVEATTQRTSEFTAAGLQAGQEVYLTLEKWTVSTLQYGIQSRIYMAKNIQAVETEKAIGPVHFINIKSTSGAELDQLPDGALLRINKVSQYLADAGLTADMASKVRLFRLDFDNASKQMVGGSYSVASDQLAANILRTGAYIMVVDTAAPTSQSGLQTGVDSTAGSVRVSANFASDLTGIDASSMVLMLNGVNVLTGKPVNELFNPIGNFFALNIPQSKFVAGVNSLDLTASDTAGNQRTWSAYITLPGVVTAPVCTLTASPAVINAGESSTLTATCVPLASAYQWSGVTGCQSTSAVCTVSPESDGTYSVTGGNSAGAGSAATVRVTVKVDQLGNQPLQPRADGTVYDPNTGLIWMRCLMGQTWSNAASNCLGNANLYTYGDAVTQSGSISFAGNNDWRMPTVRELSSIVDYSGNIPAINGPAFPNTWGIYTWSSTVNSFNGNFHWGVSYYNGEIITALQSELYALRMVRSVINRPQMSLNRKVEDYIDAGNGSITHTPTGLTWQRCLVGQSWVNNACTGTPSLLNWFDARNIFSMVGGYGDWRIPTQSELLSLIDYTKFTPSLNPVIFPSQNTAEWLWSSTQDPSKGTHALSVQTGFGFSNSREKNLSGYVRLVRINNFKSCPGRNDTNPTIDNSGLMCLPLLVIPTGKDSRISFYSTWKSIDLHSSNPIFTLVDAIQYPSNPSAWNPATYSPANNLVHTNLPGSPSFEVLFQNPLSLKRN